MKKPVFVSAQDAAAMIGDGENSCHNWNDPGICK